MRRSVEEGVNSRFVTGERVQAVLQVCYPPLFIPSSGLTYIPGNAKPLVVRSYRVYGRRSDTPGPQ
jgi:hypothetical protein